MDKANKQLKCKRCGMCCWYMGFKKVRDGETRIVWRKCRYLGWNTADKIAFCKIYPKRLGTYVGNGQYCVEESPYNIPGCPYNSKEKPLHPAFGTVSTFGTVRLKL